MLLSFCGKDVSYFSNALGGCAVFAIVWSMSVFVLSYAYSGGLVSHLTFPGYRFVPKNYKELTHSVKNNLFQAGVVDIYFIKIYFQESKYGVGKEVKKMIDNGRVLTVSIEEGLTKMYTEDFAFIFFSMDGKTILGKLGIVDVWVSEDSLSSSVYGFLTRRGFALRNKLHKAVQRTIETGFVNRLIKKKTEKWRIQKKSNDFTPLGLKELSGPFIILLIGYASSAFILVLENFFSKCHTKKQVC